MEECSLNRQHRRLELHEAAAVSSEAATNEPRVLVVDDDQGVRRTLELILERKGFRVRTATTGEQALSMATETDFNVALIDIRLPDQQGVELVGPLRAIQPDMGQVLITGYASTETAIKALNQGADAYITKPLNVDVVLKEIVDVLERQRLLADKRAAERRLRDSEERYRGLFNGVPVGLYRTTPGGRIIDVNPALVDMLGYPDRETLLQVDVAEGFLDAEARSCWQAGMEQVGIVHGFEARLKRFDGEMIWVLDSARAFRDDDGRVVYYEGSLQDITERKRAEHALEQRVRELSCLYAVQREVQRGDLEPDQLCQRIIEHIIPAMQCPDLAVPVIVLEGKRFTGPGFEAGLPEGLKADICLGDDMVGHVSVRYQEPRPFLEPAEPSLLGSIAESLALWLQRRRAGSALRESEARYRTLFNSANDAIFVHDLDGNFLEVNDVACQRLGYSREDLLQMETRDIDAKAYADKFDHRVNRLRQRGHLYMETVHTRRDGTTIPSELSTRIIDYNGGEAVLTIARDVSEREELERRLRRQERLATIGQLAGGIAHDTNNALMSIILCAELLQRDPRLPEELSKDVDTILYEAEEAADIMRQVLDFSRQAPLETRAIDLVTTVEETLHVLRRVMPESIDIVWDAPREQLVLQADPSRIHQVIMNLAINARDAMPGGGELRIELSGLSLRSEAQPPVGGMDCGEWISLHVVDSGTGLTDEAKKHLFEPFFTTKPAGAGTGLGLAQVYGIVQQHGGYIEVDSERRKGTQFEIYFPAYDEPPTVATPSGDASSPPRGNGETILVVEDERNVRETCARALEMLGYGVVTARDGREALGFVRRGESVDLVLTDIVMPNMDGLDLIKTLQLEAPQLPVVAMTGYVLDDRVSSIREDSYVPFLHKPIDQESLAEIVHIALRMQDQEASSRSVPQ